MWQPALKFISEQNTSELLVHFVPLRATLIRVSAPIYYTYLNTLLCGLVVRVPGYRSRGLGSIPGATRFSEK
jgi:hypothetical protein